MPGRSSLVLPCALLAATALLGAHCRSNESQGPLGADANPKPAEPKAVAAKTALPNDGLTEDEAKRLLPGIDTAALSPKQRKDLADLATDTFCPCASTTVAQCLRTQPACRPAVRLVELAKRMLVAGQPQAMVLVRVESYYASFAKDRRRELDADGPMKGNPAARVTLVEFSDFQCPACKAVHPVLEELVKKYPNDVKVVFKNFPLQQHPNAAKAAAAGVWAHEKGKFWPLANLFFERQEKLDDAGLEAAAKDAGLDGKAMLAAIANDPKYVAKVDEDKAVGMALQLGGTPSIFVNGRQMLLPPSMEYLTWTIEDELEWMASGGTWATK